MFNALTTERVLYEMLKESQTPGSGLPFELSSTVELYNYNPGDCRVVPYVPEDGMYLFFKKTDLSECDPAEQHHVPEFCVFVYCSRGATSGKTSPAAVHEAAKAATNSMYQCLRNTQTKRLLNERVKLETGIPDDYRIPNLTVYSVENVMMYPVMEQSTRSVSFWEIKGTYRATETPDQNPGVPISGVADSLTATRDPDPAELPPPFNPEVDP